MPRKKSEPKIEDNGADPLPPSAPKTPWSLNTYNRTFTTSGGEILFLVGLPPLMIERLLNYTGDKPEEPEVPYIEVIIAGKHKVKEANPNDPTYLLEKKSYEEALEKWTSEHNWRLIRYAFGAGVVNDVPEEFADDHKQFFPGASKDEMRRLWVASLCKTTDEMNALVDAILGQTTVTQSGLEEAADSFPSTG